MNKINNKKGFTLVELLAVIVIMGILMMVAIPSVTRTIENSRKDTFVDIAKSYGSAARNMWTTDNLTCNGTVSSAVDDGDYYILINSKEGAKDALPTLVDQGGKSSWGNRDVNGYVRVNVSTTPGVDSNNDGTYEVEPRRVTKFYVALSDGTHGLIDDNSLTMDELKRGNVVMSLSGDQLKKTELTVDDGRLDCARDANGVYSCTAVTPIKNITGVCVDDQTTVGVTGNAEPPATPVVNGSATFTDGVTLSWAELQLPENGTTYSYDSSLITNTSIGANVFRGNTTIARIIIPNSVEDIGNYAFSNASSLTSVEFQGNVSAIGNYAFYGASILETVSYYGTTPPSCGSNIFFGSSSLSFVKVPTDYTGSDIFCGKSAIKEL